MTRADKGLVLLLRTLGLGSLLALVPVFMPFSWMAATHRWLGLGELPAAPVVEYLARSLSAFYALIGGLCLVLASDLDSYRPLVRSLGVAFALVGVVFLWVDLSAGRPWWWTASEGPPGLVVGPFMFFLARPGPQECRPPGRGGTCRGADAKPWGIFLDSGRRRGWDGGTVRPPAETWPLWSRLQALEV
jgi:hypothetical protein